MKAWGVNNEECGIIVFAETRGRAKSITLGREGFDFCEFADSDIRVHRMPEIDGLKTEEGLLPWKGNERTYYEHGWYSEEGVSSCDCCGLYHYDSIPESEIEETENGDMCKACILRDKEPTQ